MYHACTDRCICVQLYSNTNMIHAACNLPICACMNIVQMYIVQCAMYNRMQMRKTKVYVQVYARQRGCCNCYAHARAPEGRASHTKSGSPRMIRQSKKPHGLLLFFALPSWKLAKRIACRTKILLKLCVRQILLFLRRIDPGRCVRLDKSLVRKDSAC